MEKVFSAAFAAPSVECVHFTEATRLGSLPDGMGLFEIDASEIGDDQSLFDALADALSFPDYFGGNWDALDECLVDLDLQRSPRGFVLKISNSQRLWSDAALSAGKLVQAWLCASGIWMNEEVASHLVFCGMKRSS